MAARVGWLKVRVSPEEKTRLQARADAEGITVADLVRARIEARLTEAPPPRKRQRPPMDPARAELVRQIAKIGNNLNQIAAWCNTYKAAAESVQVVAHLVAIEQELENVYQGLSAR
ncbi:MAG: MobC family plasmid mobilization relaxosome protein [Trichloromonadaceae bacterium]